VKFRRPRVTKMEDKYNFRENRNKEMEVLFEIKTSVLVRKPEFCI
jgi:hypothetical protein